MYRVWYSTESFADYIIDHTNLSAENPVKRYMYESDAAKPRNFHAMPDHIRKILYLDAPDLIVERNNEPIFSIEISTEAGTGHNAFQRFSRIAAAVENSVPAFYIYPEGAIITRKSAAPKWDTINPLIFKALEQVMDIYGIPALLYYYPSDIADYLNCPENAPNFGTKGLRNDPDIVSYSGCPCAEDAQMQSMFRAINEILTAVETHGVFDGRHSLLRNLVFREQRDFMQLQFATKSNGKPAAEMSPLSAVTVLPTDYLLRYLAQFEDASYEIGDLLRQRAYTAFYQVNAKFRGDPYPGALAAIDYLTCREGKTYEDRQKNLVLVFGKIVVNEDNETMDIVDDKVSTIADFFKTVKNTENHNLLTRDYSTLRNYEIPRYFMQVRYGSTYSKAKHIRVFSYFADAILFPDGSLWRDG